MRRKSKFHLFEIFYNDMANPDVITYDNTLSFEKFIECMPELYNTVFISESIVNRVGIILNNHFELTDKHLIMNISCGDLGVKQKIVHHDNRTTRDIILEDSEFSATMLNCIVFGINNNCYMYVEGKNETISASKIVSEFNDNSHKFYIKKVVNPKTLEDLFNERTLLEVDYTYIEADMDGIPENISVPERVVHSCKLSRNRLRGALIDGRFFKMHLGTKIPQKVTYSLRDESGGIEKYILGKSSYYKTYQGIYNDEIGEWEREQLMLWLRGLVRENINDIFN